MRSWLKRLGGTFRDGSLGHSGTVLWDILGRFLNVLFYLRKMSKFAMKSPRKTLKNSKKFSIILSSNNKSSYALVI